MHLTEITFDGMVPVDGYGPGFFRVGGQVVEGGLLLLADRALSWAGPEDAAAVTACAGACDIVLFGTGAEMTAVPDAFRAAIEGAGLGLEPMASPAACRTYNILVASGRRVALAVLPV